MRRNRAGLFLLSTLLLAASLPATAGDCGCHAVSSTTVDDGTVVDPQET